MFIVGIMKNEMFVCERCGKSISGRRVMVADHSLPKGFKQEDYATAEEQLQAAFGNRMNVCEDCAKALVPDNNFWKEGNAK